MIKRTFWVLKTFRVLIMTAMIVFGGCWYASYKFGELKRQGQVWLNNAQNTVTNIFDNGHVPEVKLPDVPEDWLKTVQDTANAVSDSAGNVLKAAESHVSEVKLPDISKIDVAKFIEDTFGKQKSKEGSGEGEGSEGEKSQAWISDVQDTATKVFNSATDSLKLVGSHVTEVKPSETKLPDIKEGGGEGEGSEGERQSNKNPPTDKA